MTDSTQDSYDRVADEYTRRIYDELRNKPFDRKMLDWLIELVGQNGQSDKPICDMGCGPGHIARYLRDQGANVQGIDLSLGMVKQASTLNPDILFAQGNMLDLNNVEDGTFSGIAAFYCILHIPADKTQIALTELKRILSIGGTLLVTFHIGQEVQHRDEWWGQSVSLDFRFLEPEAIKTTLQEVGFEIVESIQRDPYPEVEVQTRRAYIFARKVS
jgi:ubiquinone/menaquinone biosynthesis C-methylase UbiE